jgi:hypothetical protein
LGSGCVVFGRVAGDGAASYLLKQYSTGAASTAQQRVGQIANHLETKIRINPEDQNVTLTFSWAGQGGVQSSSSSSSGAPQSSQPGPSSSETSNVAGPEGPGQGKEPPKKKELKEYTMEEVAKHNKNDDAWVVVDGKVLDVTEFLPCVSVGLRCVCLCRCSDHPGGARAILLYKGKECTEVRFRDPLCSRSCPCY